MMKVKILRLLECKLNDNRKFMFFCLLLLTFHLSLFALSANAQTDEPADAEPPPIKNFTTEEKNQLDAVTDAKPRTELALKLMETRLKKAEDLYAQESYAEMFVELGGFQALIDNTLNFLNRSDNGSRKVFSNYKKLEMSLRGYLNRLEIMRRELPIKYEFYVRGLEKVVRDARTKAVEPLFSDTIVTDTDKTN
jgi:hypothetical protein